MRIVFCCISLLILLLPSSGSRAASLQHLSGNVLVNKGDGFKSAINAGALEPGDRVLAQPGAKAQIVYDAQCAVQVEPGLVVSVAARSPCRDRPDWPRPAGLAGCTLKGDPDTCRIEPDREDIPPLLISAGAFGLAVGGLILLENDHPASP